MKNMQKLSPIQLELLKVYSFDPTEHELQEVRAMLGKYFAYRHTTRLGNEAAKRGITDQDLDAWLLDES